MFARRPHWAKRWPLAPLVQTRGPRPHVTLTFDDGPDPEHTPEVLDRLKRFGLTAAFFLVGRNAAASPELVLRIAAEGHALGNHTFSHRRLGPFAFAASARDVIRCQDVVPGARLFRPPLGRLTPALWLAARRLGLRCVNWSLDGGDWGCRSAADAAECGRQLLEQVRPGDVVLLHDHHRWIGPILDVVLPGLAGRADTIPSRCRGPRRPHSEPATWTFLSPPSARGCSKSSSSAGWSAPATP